MDRGARRAAGFGCLALAVACGLAVNDASAVSLELARLLRGAIPTRGAADRAEVAEVEVAWRDDARGRDVPARVYAPRDRGPFPLVVFSHGFGESMTSYAHHARRWAAHGYVTVVPNHAGSDGAALRDRVVSARRGGGRPPAPFALRPRDLSFAIDRALASDEPLLRGRVDAARIAVAGHSLGSSTALAMVGLSTLEDGERRSHRDPRVRAAIAMSPQVGRAAGDSRERAPGRLERLLDARSWDAIDAPVMMLTGTRDAGFGALRRDPGLRRIAFDSLPPGAKYLVSLEGAEHHAFTDTRPWYSAGERDPRHYEWIHRATTAFLDAHLRGDVAARKWLEAEALERETGGLAAQESRLAGGAAATTPRRRRAVAPRSAHRRGAAANPRARSGRRRRGAARR